ncbi:hypothetical protein AB6Q56_04005 [Dechloromonas sp. ARDL1]|uniref:hypothetical protein n=1 Tax=Dechloromonas sp. ARDL1 TaxID=3322121 RepID=UPI003DA6D074
MSVVDQAVLLAGYLLAHSAANLSFVEEVKVLTPFSICLRNGQLYTKFHTGKTQAEAVVNAKEELSVNAAKCDAWAFTREGRMEEEGRTTMSLAVSAWANGMNEQIVFIQRFSRAPKFRLNGSPTVAIGERLLESSESEPLLTVLRTGISRHEEGGPQWNSWY